MKIAGYPAQVHSLFDSTRDYCRKYLTEGEADVSIAVAPEDLDFEQEELRREAMEEGMRVRTFTDPFLERAAIQRGMAEYLFDRDILMLHGSAVAADGEGYLFTADCGTGKSTHTRLWRQLLGDRAVMVNDDKPFAEIREDGVRLWGSPWSGKHGLDTNITVPLKGICILRRGKENRIRPITAMEAAPMLRKQSYQPLDPGKATESRKLVDSLMETVPLWELECTKDLQAAAVAYEAMAFDERKT